MHGLGRELTLRHLPVFGMPTFIRVIPRRGICKYCDDTRTATERLSWHDPNSKYTEPYEQNLLFELVNSTVADVSAKEEVEYHSIEALIDKYIEQTINFDAIEALGIMGLDEISLKKGHRYFVTLVTYRHQDKIHLLALAGRQKAVVEAFPRQIPPRLTQTMTAICCDLYEGYIQAAKAVIKNETPIVADRFHVAKLYRRSLVILRKAELRRLKKQLSPEA
jgi:transposase